jgi:ubiquinone/menaquinone biosynthesis C-methylase UbiE
MTSVYRQFTHPTGWLGAVVGMLMAVKNRERSEWVLSQLGAAPGDRVLEIGFGPGVDIARVAASGASVAGLDRSDVMVRQASRRSAAAIRAGRVDLRHGAMPELPFADASFDKAYAINSYQFWPHTSRSLAELRRVLRPGGLVVLAVQPRTSGATDVTAKETGEEIAQAVREAGFDEVRLLLKPMKPVATACVTATVKVKS